MQLTSRSGCLLWLLFGLALAVCQAQQSNHFEDVNDGGEGDAWQAGVFLPQPLKPAPWQESSTPSPTPSSGLLLAGVGELHGLRGFKTIKNRPIDAFLGIRYAQVNSGLGRFQQAIAVPYQAHIDATRASPNCAQFPEQQRLREAEARGENVDDCLTLNVYAPAGARDLPVVVFVHGEMLFDGGAEEAQPDYVLEHDVVLVSINYRLAPFGFLSAQTDELPGNVALSDLHLALEWVQRNIRYFGGASSQITLVGQAGGATLAHALSLSPRTQHLFQQLILQSGTALNPYLIDERPLETLASFARLANCPSNGRSLGPLYECLRRLPTSQLVGIFEQLFQQNEPRGLSYLGGFKLVVGDRLGYLPEHPAALVASNNITKPLIVGATKDAGAFILSRFYDQIQQIQSNNVSDYINVVLRHTAPPQQHKIWHDWALREIFTPDQLRYVNAQSVSQGLLELTNLILYRAPVIYSIRSSHKKSPTFLYSFDYRGQHHRFGHLSNPLPFGVDASLSDDSVYLFPYPEETSNLNPRDKSLSRALVAMWVNFAVNGVPNPVPNVWPKATSEYGPFLRLTNSDRNFIELDQHFGEGINVPNLYAQYFNMTNSSQAATTTTTTSRPFNNGYRPQPPINRPKPANEDIYTIALQQRRQQLLREEQERVQRQRAQVQQEEQQRNRLREEETRKLREEQQRREQQRRSQFLYEQRQREQKAKQQREEQLRAEQERREQQQREQLQREQQEREQQPQQPNTGSPIYNDYARQQQEQQQREEERLREEREQEAREQQEREQQRREQLQREQEEREQQPNPYEYDHPLFKYKLRQQQEQQQREEERLREQEAREQQEHEQQRREQLQREQQEREQQPQSSEPGSPTYEDYVRQQQEQQQREEERLIEEREQAAREQQEREQQRDREQQRREQLQREEQEREQQPHQSESGNSTNDDYVRQQQEQQQREQERSGEEREQETREQQEQEQQRREQLQREQEEREQQPYPLEPGNPTYEDYLRQQQEQQQREEERLREEREQEARDQQEREQQRREQLQGEHEERDQQPNSSESESPTYEDYLRQQQEQQQREEERLREEREQEEREQQAREQHKEREKQRREELQREQEARDQQLHSSVSGDSTYDDFVSEQQEQQQRELERLNEERRGDGPRQEQLQQDQGESEQLPLFTYRELGTRNN